MKIVFAGGGSGGHIFPLIAIIREIKAVAASKTEFQGKSFGLYYVGPCDKLALELFSKEGLTIMPLTAGKFRRYLTPQAILANLIDILFKVPFSIIQALFKLYFLAPDLIVSKGGFGSFPVVLSALILQIPFFVHESDAVAGRTNRLIGRFAEKVLTSFEKTEGFPKEKVLVTGNPLRQELLTGNRGEAIARFGLTDQKPIVLIIGGSQGAQRVNSLVLNILPEWLSVFELIHVTGPENYDKVEKEAEVVIPDRLRPYYHPLPFLNEDDLRHAYQASHIIVSRAGAGSIFEIAALGKPSLLIPLPEAAQDHQVKNAYEAAKAGVAVAIEHASLTPHFLLEKIKDIFDSPDEYAKLCQRAKAFARPEAARVIAEYVLGSLV